MTLLLAVLLTACTSTSKQPEGFEVETETPSGVQIRPTPDTSKAALALLSKARSAAKAGKLDVAESQLERALRIEPRNAVLWHYMAKLRLYQGRLEQAAGLAAKSNSLDKGDRQLRADNWRIIAHARYQKGDKAGADAAQQQVDKLTR